MCVCVCVYYILYFIFIFIFIYVADMDFGLHIEGALCTTSFYVQSQFRRLCEIELVACSSF